MLQRINYMQTDRQNPDLHRGLTPAQRMLMRLRGEPEATGAAKYYYF